MTIKPLNAALLAAGLAAGSAATALISPQWLNPAPAQPQTTVSAQANSGAIANETSTPSQAAQTGPVPYLAAGGVPNFRAIVKQAGPAVVGVTVEGMRRASREEQGMPEAFSDPRSPFSQFFRGQPGQRGHEQGGQPFRGQGSGFIISSDGLILTNAHVVNDAKEVTIKLSDRREFSAKVLGLDKATDIAVLRIQAKDLPTVRLGDPRQLEVGDPVLAIGAPFGLEQTATQGIVSAKGRSLPNDAVVPFIQTDAAVNPGNSGGPLFDGSGGVIGINSQIYSQSGGYQGLSFAIPINVALKVKDQIVATGSAQHARLGVAVQDLTQSLADSFGMARPDGALIAQISPNSAAAKAGLKPGDVVTEVDGEPVVRSGALSSLIGLSAPGDKVKLKIWRDHAPQTLNIVLGGAEAEAKLASTAAAPQGRLGLALRPLNKEESRALGLGTGAAGMLIEETEGPAARAGINAGDVLLAINGRPAQSTAQVREVLAKSGNMVALLIQRGDSKIFVPVKLG
ncbi:Do family serine endopeptidase [Roseateles oligotrophus]|uniref:Probable periplasmic serine endoprotease DegP-like n=1 Tax=Roseateles oligotrophus TaxID=1769250 RepID=A0ABT2YEG1_9BURK|nr:Do family serine endopeptidase [Roseateles oligotrophus]MCV2368412.1 Do family serine endopeptidase [Roseateles oligotrophus]